MASRSGLKPFGCDPTGRLAYLTACALALLILSTCDGFGVSETSVGAGHSVSKASATTLVCDASWLKTQVNGVRASLKKSAAAVTTALAKASKSPKARSVLRHAMLQISKAESFIAASDFSRARKKVELLQADLTACQQIVASLPGGASWKELATALVASTQVCTQLTAMAKRCKAKATPSTAKPVNPPPPPSRKSDSVINSTVPSQYEAYGWEPYQSADGEWSADIYATSYGNNQGTDTFGQCFGRTPNAVSTKILGVYNSAASKVLLQLGAECGACYQIRCTETKLCKTDLPVMVRLTNSCPKATGKSYPWCDFPRIHFDMSKPAFSAIADPIVGALRVQYRRVACPVDDKITFHVSSIGNSWWIPISILNVGGPGSVRKVWVKPSDYTNWIPVEWSWGSNWSIHRKPYLLGKSLSFKLELRGSDQEVISENVFPADWSFGRSYVGNQFDPEASDISSEAQSSVSDASAA